MKLSIPQPCHQDWNKMTPNEKGAFCKACCKTVHDLTSKTTEEITDLLTNAGRICVRIRSSALVALPVRNQGRLRAFACALMLVFGSMLFSCNNHPGDDVIMGDIAVNDSLKAPVTDTALGIKDTTPSIVQNTVPVASQDTSARKKKKQVEVKANEEQEQDVQQPRKHPYPLPMEPRWTGGGKEELQKFISANTKYPEEARKNKIVGTVMVSFTVKADGKATSYKVFRGLGYGCDEEALRVAKLLSWEPGKQGGEVSDMEYSIAVPFGE